MVKNVNVCDLINIISWDNVVEIRDRRKVLIYGGIAHNVPDYLAMYEVDKIEMGLGHFAIILHDVYRV